ncbi:alpha-(1,3)-fucosyltransferase C-like [Trichoplusia ni]|uniref:Fucosyltransferase n=1 Tax=Trichoplusia ni TaxID=7111 RepID=A0A7E5VNB1_TRINI|nr:alpha-(1,3)-fucosyltransferase C-like [Trichoplusia ni]
MKCTILLRKKILSVLFFVVFVTVITHISQLTDNPHWYTSYTKEKEPGMKYILLWTKQDNIPFKYMGKGRSGFIERKCPYTNCIVTGDRKLLNSVLDFDVIAFAGPELWNANKSSMPSERLPYQKYVFASIESPHNYPLCIFAFDGYFNWTWTYKLDSDIRWGYIVIRDIHNKIVGPKTDMHWLRQDQMSPVNETFKRQLKSKTKAAVWFVSNCYTRSVREGFIIKLGRVLYNYNLKLAVYGRCGYLNCSREEQDRCDKIVRERFYFYLAFENAFSEDYVTEKLLTPLQNNAVPIVYGAANYTRFLPEGSYLNAQKLGIYQLAEKMDELIRNPDMYAEYFRWKNHYTYHKTTDSVETNEYCKMCAALNDEESVRKKTVCNDFSGWWESYKRCDDFKDSFSFY